jgi:plastocyanin
MAIASPALASETIRVSIDKLKFDPAQVSAHVGDTIEWVSSDIVAHTATARNKN